MTEYRREHRRQQHRDRRAAARAAGRHRPFAVCDLWRHTSANVCGLCGGIIHDRAHASVDHIIPLSRGGTDIRENVQLAHKLCNWRKGNNQPQQMEQLA